VIVKIYEMLQPIIMNGIKASVLVDPEALLKDIVQLAINQTGNVGSSWKEFFCMCDDDILNLNSKISEQYISNTGVRILLEGRILYIIHISNSNLVIRKVNPYRSSNFF
jgi:hypothetical protein